MLNHYPWHFNQALTYSERGKTDQRMLLIHGPVIQPDIPGIVAIYGRKNVWKRCVCVSVSVCVSVCVCVCVCVCVWVGVVVVGVCVGGCGVGVWFVWLFAVSCGTRLVYEGKPATSVKAVHCCSHRLPAKMAVSPYTQRT